MKLSTERNKKNPLRLAHGYIPFRTQAPLRALKMVWARLFPQPLPLQHPARWRHRTLVSTASRSTCLHRWPPHRPRRLRGRHLQSSFHNHLRRTLRRRALTCYRAHKSLLVSLWSKWGPYWILTFLIHFCRICCIRGLVPLLVVVPFVYITLRFPLSKDLGSAVYLLYYTKCNRLNHRTLARICCS